jgi:hypothetical protein
MTGNSQLPLFDMDAPLFDMDAPLFGMDAPLFDVETGLGYYNFSTNV